MKVKIFWYFEILNIQIEKSHYRETAKTAILEEKQKKIRTTIVATKIATRKLNIGIEDNSRVSRDCSELQRLCRYNRCEAVHNNGEGWKSSLPEGR